MKLGFSLSPRLLLGEPGNEAERTILQHFGSPQALLTELRGRGVESIELRYILREEKQDCSRLYSLIWEQGLHLTVHGRIEGTSQGARFVENYPSLQYALQHYKEVQEQLVITLHAYYAQNDPSQSVGQLSEATILQLQSWVKMIEEEQLNIRIAVELTRRIPNKTDPGGNVDTLVSLVRTIDNDHCGICWDMGHYYSNLLSSLNAVSLPETSIAELPPDTFLQRTYHTHIHGLSERCKTHFPLVAQESLPLELYVKALRGAGYQGVFNLELDFPRYSEQPDFIDKSLASIDRLRHCGPRGNDK